MKFRYSNIKYILILFAIITILFSSCNEDKKIFTDDEFKTIDSLYNLRKKEIKTRLDTICDSVYNAEYPIMVDSIKSIRKKEILDLIGN